MNTACKANFLTRPRGQKIKYHSVSITKFSYQNLCLFSQIKDIKHIKQDFNSVAWVVPQGRDLGVLGGQFFFSKHGHVAYQIEGAAE